jgi:hypothetical protein
MKTFFIRSLFFAFALCLVSLVRAESVDAVKARMAQRLAQVDGLKEQGAVGENNRGFLEVRGGPAEAGAVVSAENKDREIVYAAVAQKTGITAEQVGQKRAARLAQASRSGVWVQDESGSWKKK